MTKPKRLPPPQTCSIEGCERHVIAIGLCKSHYTMRRKAEQRAMNLAVREGDHEVDDGVGPFGALPKLSNDEATIKRIHDLAGLQCTIPEIAGVLQVTEPTLAAFFKKHNAARRAFKEGQQNGRASLRRMQFVQAKRSAAMAIWLGKNYLGQRDNLELGPINKDGTLELGTEENATALLRAVRVEGE